MVLNLVQTPIKLVPRYKETAPNNSEYVGISGSSHMQTLTGVL